MGIVDCRIAVVTGAAQRIGPALAAASAAEGASLFGAISVPGLIVRHQRPSK